MVNAGIIMESFFRSNSYGRMKAAEKLMNSHYDVVKNNLRTQESKVHEFVELGSIVRWIKKPIYQVDKKEMNEHLYDLGWLHMTVNLDPNKVPEDFELSSFVIPQPKVLGVSVNKKGRVPNPLIAEHNLEYHIGSYQKYKKVQELCAIKYKRLKKRMLKCDVLKEKNKIKHEFGSVYLKENSRKIYDMEKVLEKYGPAFLIEYGIPNSGAIEECILKGRIHPRELEQFKRIVDYRLDMVILTNAADQKIFEYMQNRTRIISENLGA